MKILGLLAGLSILAGCGCAHTKGVVEVPHLKVDTSKIIRVSGRWSLGSACPIGPHAALSAAHVIDPRPFDKGISLVPVMFQQGEVFGNFRPEHTWANRDLALLITDSLLEYYEFAKVLPAVGSTVRFSGYEWRSKRNAFAERVWEAKVLRVVAGLLIYDPAGEPGTSGSCVLNEAGELVAVNTAGISVGSLAERVMGGEQVGLGVLVVGETF